MFEHTWKPRCPGVKKSRGEHLTFYCFAFLSRIKNHYIYWYISFYWWL